MPNPQWPIPYAVAPGTHVTLLEDLGYRLDPLELTGPAPAAGYLRDRTLGLEALETCDHLDRRQLERNDPDWLCERLGDITTWILVRHDVGWGREVDLQLDLGPGGGRLRADTFLFGTYAGNFGFRRQMFAGHFPDAGWAAPLFPWGADWLPLYNFWSDGLRWGPATTVAQQDRYLRLAHPAADGRTDRFLDYGSVLNDSGDRNVRAIIVKLTYRVPDLRAVEGRALTVGVTVNQEPASEIALQRFGRRMFLPSPPALHVRLDGRAHADLTAGSLEQVFPLFGCAGPGIPDRLALVYSSESSLYCRDAGRDPAAQKLAWSPFGQGFGFTWGLRILGPMRRKTRLETGAETIDHLLVQDPVGRQTVFTRRYGDTYPRLPTNKFTPQSRGIWGPPFGRTDLEVEIEELPGGGWTLGAGPHSDQYRFDPLGRLVSVKSPGCGRAAEITWNGNSFEVVDSSGRRTRYRASGEQITEVVDPAQAVWSFSYDGPSLVEIRSPLGLVARFDYDRDLWVMRTRYDETGLKTAYGYSVGTPAARMSWGTFNRSETTDPSRGSVVHGFAYASSTLDVTCYGFDQWHVTHTNPRGFDTRYEMRIWGSAWGGPTLGGVRVVPPAGAIQQLGYSPFSGQLTSDSLLAGRELGYDSDAGYLRRTSIGGIGAVQLLYAAGNPRRLERYVDALGKEEVYEYVDKGGAQDLLSRLSRASANGQPALVVEYEWSDDGDMVRESETGGEVNVFEYHTQPGHLGLKKTITHCQQAAAELGVDEIAYDPYGRVAEFRGGGDTYRHEYDCFGEAVAESVESGGATSVRRWITTPDRRTTSELDFDGSKTTYAFDGFGAVTGIESRDAAGELSSWSFGYDANGNRISVTQPNGETVAMEYDALDRLAKVTTSLGTDEYARDANGHLLRTTQTDSAGAARVTDYTVAPDGQLTKVEYPPVPLPDGSPGTWRPTVRFERFANGSVRKVVTALGPQLTAEAEYELDEDGRPARVRRKVGATHYETGEPLDALGQILMQEGPEYDWSGVSSGTTTGDPDVVGGDSGGLRSQLRFVHDCRARLREVLDRAGQPLLRLGYSGNDALASIEAPDPSSPATPALVALETRALDPHGREASITTATGDTTTLAYDAEGRLADVAAASGAAQRFAYDDCGRIGTVRLEAAGAPGLETRYEYRAGLVSAIEHVNRLPSGRDQVQRYEITHHRLLGLPETKRDPLQRVSRTEYDDFGNAVALEVGGRRIEYAYDAMNRLASKRFAASGEAASYRYDGVGSLTFAENDVARASWRYDELGRLLERSVTFKASGVTKSLRYQYDQFGNLFSRRDGEGYRVEMGYDEHGRLLRLASGGSVLVRQAHGAGGALWTRELPDAGIRSTWTYDRGGKVRRIVHERGGQPLSAFDYVRNDAGQVLETRREGLAQAGRFERDGLGRLVAETVTAPTHALHRVERVFDAIGNVTIERGSGGLRLVSSDACNQIAGVSDAALQRIDAAGIAPTADSEWGAGFEAARTLDGDATDSLGPGVGWCSDAADTEHALTWTFSQPRALAVAEIAMPSSLGEAAGLRLMVLDTAGSWRDAELLGLRGGRVEPAGLRFDAGGATVFLRPEPVLAARLVRPVGRGFGGAPATHRACLAVLEATLLEASLQATAFAYDALGCRARQGATALQHDDEGRLRRATSAAFDVEYRYGPEGRLAERIDHRTGATTLYLFDGPWLFAEYDAAGTPLRRYLLAAHEPVALGYLEGSGAAASWRHFLLDERDSVAEVVDAAGQVLDRYLYDPWGSVLDRQEAAPQPMRFMGHLHDDVTGVIFWHMRAYDPRHRTFLERDPLSGSAHAYAFLGNDPLTERDPLGLGWLPQWVERAVDTVVETAKEVPGALFEDFASGAARDRLGHFLTGTVQGGVAATKAAVNGVVRVVTHPVETLEQAAEKVNYAIWHPRDAAEQALQGLRTGVQDLRREAERLAVLARDDPNRFAEEVGRLTGQAMVNVAISRGAAAGQGVLASGAARVARECAKLSRLRTMSTPFTRPYRYKRCYWNNSAGSASKGNFRLPREDGDGKLLRPAWPKTTKDHIRKRYPGYDPKKHDICHGVPASLLARSIEKLVNEGISDLDDWLTRAGFSPAALGSVERAATAFFHHRCTHHSNVRPGDRHTNRSLGGKMAGGVTTKDIEHFVIDRAQALWAQGKTWDG